MKMFASLNVENMKRDNKVAEPIDKVLSFLKMGFVQVAFVLKEEVRVKKPNYI